MDRLYRRYAVWLHRRLRSSVGPEAAADVVQDTYIRIAPYADRGIRHPKAFLLKVAMNLVRDNHRTEARKNRRIAELAPPDAEAPPQFTQVLLGQVVRDMPQLYRDVFVLSRFGGMTYDVRGEFVVIHGAPRMLRLRQGRLVVCLFNDSWTPHGASTSTATASPAVDRTRTGDAT